MKQNKGNFLYNKLAYLFLFWSIYLLEDQLKIINIDDIKNE